jgi:hypothetical protein
MAVCIPMLGRAVRVFDNATCSILGTHLPTDVSPTRVRRPTSSRHEAPTLHAQCRTRRRWTTCLEQGRGLGGGRKRRRSRSRASLRERRDHAPIAVDDHDSIRWMHRRGVARRSVVNGRSSSRL